MQLYRDFIGHAAGLSVNALKGEPPPHGLQRMDFQVTKEIADFAQTILFSADQALALRPALEDFGERVEYRLPFPMVILQFDHPIPEREFFELERVDESDPALLRRMAAHWAAAGLTLHGWEPAQGDAVAALLLHQGETDAGEVYNQAVAWFVSTAANRVYWVGTDLRYIDPTLQRNEENKRTLRNLAMACVAYINCVNLELTRHETPEKVNRKRAAKGKRVLDPYYTIDVRPEYRREGEDGGHGSQHGHRYDVRGHFRRLQDGRLTWVRPHQRGLSHDLYIPAVRRVKGE